ncbi:MAG: N-acetylmuramoyl-L-alanine amidase, partial [Pseudorhodobacter sp.]
PAPDPETGDTPPDPERFDRDLTAFGYPQADPEARLHAFRLRFAPGRQGPLSARDCAAATDLARRFAVDARPPQA